MPRVSRWLVRAALLYLLAGFTLGALLLADKGVPFAPSLWRFVPLHYEWLLVGWFVQLILGTAYWIFPRFGLPPAARRRERLAWLGFALVNAGILLVTAGVALAAPAGMVAAGRALEAAAVAAFAAGLWGRVRPGGLSPM